MRQLATILLCGAAAAQYNDWSRAYAQADRLLSNLTLSEKLTGGRPSLLGTPKPGFPKGVSARDGKLEPVKGLLYIYLHSVLRPCRTQRRTWCIRLDFSSDNCKFMGFWTYYCAIQRNGRWIQKERLQCNLRPNHWTTWQNGLGRKSVWGIRMFRFRRLDFTRGCLTVCQGSDPYLNGKL